MTRARNEKKKRFSRKGVSADTLNKRASQSGFGENVKMVADGITMYKVADGDNCIRIMPPLWAADNTAHFAYDVFVHYGQGSSGRDAYICPESMGKHKCPICAAKQAATDAGDEDRAKELRVTKRAAMYLIDRDNEDDGVFLWLAPWTIDRDMSQLSVDKRTGSVYWLDCPDEGYDFSFNKSGKGIGTKYSGAALSRRSSSVDEKHLDWVEAHPLPDQLIFASEEDLLAAIGGQPTKEKEPDPLKVPTTWDEVTAMSEEDILALCESKGIEVESDDIEKLQDAVADALGLE